MIIFELILKQKYFKWYQQFKYYHEMHLKCHIIEMVNANNFL